MMLTLTGMPCTRAVATSVAALLCPLTLVACSGSDDEASSTTQAGSAGCVTEPGSATNGPVTIEIVTTDDCGDTRSGIVRVTNQGELSCSSNFNAIVSGNRLAFFSESGFGGEVGRWAPIPESEPDPVGVIEYPTGTREWPILLPAGLSGGLNWSIPAIDCGVDSYPFSVDFSAG